MFLLLLLLLVQPLQAQAGRSIDWYHDEASKAIANENYETAVRIIEEGKAKYPDSPDLNLLLANLYYDKELYNLAVAEYLEAEKKGGEDYYTLSQISRSYGKLNQEEDSISCLKKILSLYPDNVTTVDDLGWMYFKTHQLKKGEELLLGAVNRYGPERGLFMTLGTLYSGMYDYENSRRFYLKAIEEALATGDDYFVSVAYYNLSLLEHSFYYYNSALRYTEESIRSADRAPGHLARGELYQSRMDFNLALAEYQKALGKDTTCLSKVNLAILYQQFGQLELARRYAEEVLSSRDLAWMYYYGTDLERHYKDIHEILADIYRGLARIEIMKPESNPLQRFKALFLSIKYRLIAYYHRQKFRLYSIRVGKAYLEEKNLLDANWEFYRGNEAYARVALNYLEKARKIEVQVAPHADAYYLQEEGKIRKSVRLLEESISDLDPFWEKEGIADSLIQLIALLKKGASRRQAINRLYSINPGGLQQHGYGLPLVLEISSENDRDRRIRHIFRFLRKAGSEIGPGDKEGFDYRLEIQLNSSQEASFRLTNRLNGRVLIRGSVKTPTGRARKRAAQIAQAIIDKMYSAG
ncbi:hypothetical protein ES703_13190 [subsurface metagenome]